MYNDIVGQVGSRRCVFSVLYTRMENMHARLSRSSNPMRHLMATTLASVLYSLRKPRHAHHRLLNLQLS